MKNRYLTLIGVIIGFLLAFFSDIVAFDKYDLAIDKNDVDSSKWNLMNLDVQNGVITLETFSNRITLFLDEKGMLTSFRNYDKEYLTDSLCVSNYEFEISFENSGFYCRMKED